MFNRRGKWIGLLLIAAVLTLMLSACTENAANQPPAQIDAQSLEKVSLNFYIMGDSPNDLDKVTAAINEKLLQDLNAEVKFHFSTWTEWANKYNLMLTSGERMDAVYAANWLQYFSNTQKGAFLPLDDLLPQYAPDVWNLIPADRWDGARVNGDIYGIPTAAANFVQYGVLYREDLREKYDLPKITDIDTLEQYLTAVKANEPDMDLPLAESDIVSTFFVATTPYQFIDSQDRYGPTMGLLVASPDNPTELVSIFDLPEHKAMVAKVKGWTDAGFVSRSILSSQALAEDEFQAGKAAAYLSGHLSAAAGIGLVLQSEHPEWKVDWYPYNAMNGLIQPSLPTQDLTAIPRNSANPERALMAVNKFMTDKSYYNLVRYGIEGLNFNVTAGGALDTSAIPEEHRFDMGSWAWVNESLDYPRETQWSERQKLWDSLKEQAVANPFAGFALDVTPVQTELGAIQQVYDQYVLPLHAGLVDDVDSAYQTAIDRLNAAGFGRFKEEIQRQLSSYLGE